jgi:hypothetical protein
VFDLCLIRLAYLHLMVNEQLNVLCGGDVWRLSGLAAERFALVNEFLGHLADRNYSPRTQRAYAFDLLAFGRWLETEGVVLAEVDTDVLLRFLTACREAVLPGRPGGNVYSIRDGRSTGYAPTTINRRLAAVSALFAFRQMRDPTVRNPVPRGRQARGLSRGERSGLWHTWRSRPRAPGYDSASRSGCLVACPGMSPRCCLEVSGPGGTGLSPA